MLHNMSNTFRNAGFHKSVDVLLNSNFNQLMILRADEDPEFNPLAPGPH